MKALVFLGPNSKAMESRPKPVVKAPTDAIVQMTMTTICGTDLHILKGDVPSCQPGRILGHEGIGVIDNPHADTSLYHIAADANHEAMVMLSDILQAYDTFAHAADSHALKVIINVA